MGTFPPSIQNRSFTTEPLDALFAQSVSNFTIASPTVASGILPASLVYNFTASPGHLIVIGNEVLLLDVAANKSFYAKALNVVGDVITVDRPVDHIFPIASTLGRRVITEMSVNGSVTPSIFSLRAGAIASHANRFIITMLCSSALDNSKFGNIAALTRGLVFRIVNSFQKTIFCFKTNRDIEQFSFDTKITPKAGAGDDAFSARISFNGQDKHDTTLVIKDTDVLQWVVQDDLTTITSLKVSVQGRMADEETEVD